MKTSAAIVVLHAAAQLLPLEAVVQQQLRCRCHCCLRWCAATHGVL